MLKHLKIRKLMAIEAGRTLNDGRFLLMQRLDIKLGQVPVLICRLDGKLRGLEMTDPVIEELLEL